MFESFTKGFVEQLGDSLTRYEIESLPMGAYLICESKKADQACRGYGKKDAADAKDS